MKLVKVLAYDEYSYGYATGVYDEAWGKQFAGLYKPREKHVNPDHILNIEDVGGGFLCIEYVEGGSGCGWEWVKMNIGEAKALFES